MTLGEGYTETLYYFCNIPVDLKLVQNKKLKKKPYC